MFKIFGNPTFQKALAKGVISLLKVGGMTVISVYMSRATHEMGKSLVADISQDYRLIKHQTSIDIEGSV